MPAPEVLPKYVYKILDAEPASPIPEALPLSELDTADGFIHLSTASQVSSHPPPPKSTQAACLLRIYTGMHMFENKAGVIIPSPAVGR